MLERMREGWNKPPPTVVKRAKRKKTETEKKRRGEKEDSMRCGAIKEYDGNKSL